MDNHLFRSKSIERVSSPEQLNDYIRVSNPSVWMLLGAVITLLVGVCVWGVFGRVDTKLGCVCISDGGRSVVYVSESDRADVAEGMSVTAGEWQCAIAQIDSAAVPVDGTFTEYALHVGNLTPGQWVYQMALDTVLPEGIYAAEIVVESVSPMSFVVN